MTNSRGSAKRYEKEELDLLDTASEEPVSIKHDSLGTKHGNKKPGRPALTYIDILKKDTGWDSDSIKTAMQDHGVWKAIVDWGHDPP